MERPKRKAHKNATITNLLRSISTSKPVAPKTKTVSTQTEPMQKENFDGKKSIKPKPKGLQEKKPDLPEDVPVAEMGKPGTKNKASQTQRIVQKRVKCESVLETLEATMRKRRKMSNEEDRMRLKRLMAEINNDPPPSWNIASLMWLDVDVLERRIEEYEKEEEEKKNKAKRNKKEGDD